MSSLAEKSVINSLNKSLNFSFSKSLEHSRSVNISTSEDPLQCDVCDGTTQHFCIICNKNVCNIFCSEQDPDSTNELRRRHRLNDPRCKKEQFTCYICDEVFLKKISFDAHMNNHNENSHTELTLEE